MNIDLKNDKDFIIENVAKLLGSKDDTEHRQLRVTKEGIAFLSDEVGAINSDELLFRLETWNIGNGHTGYSAEKNKNFVQRIYDCLKKNYPNPIDSYIDQF